MVSKPGLQFIFCDVHWSKLPTNVEFYFLTGTFIMPTYPFHTQSPLL